MASGGPSAVQKVEDLDVGALVVSAATHVVKKRPVTVSLWAFGLLLAAFANGFKVDETTRIAYTETLSHAEEVAHKELSKALRHLARAEQDYYNSKGWFSCDHICQKQKDRTEMAKAEVYRIEQKMNMLLKEARREVGIWSTFGVQDVRNSFWTAWKSGKDWAARWTMMDAFFMMLPGSQEESMISVVLKIVAQYVINLTMGLIGAFFFFIYNVYTLIVSYGEPALSGLAFFLLVLVAGVATVGTYLFAIYGTIAGGGLLLIKQAAKQAALNGGQQQQRPRRVQYGNYGGGPVGGARPHRD